MSDDFISSLAAVRPVAITPQPSRWRVMVVMMVVVYILALCVGEAVSTVLAAAPVSLRLLVTVVIEVFLVTYVIMPRMIRLLARWIYRSNGS